MLKDSSEQDKMQMIQIRDGEGLKQPKMRKRGSQENGPKPVFKFDLEPENEQKEVNKEPIKQFGEQDVKKKSKKVENSG